MSINSMAEDADKASIEAAKATGRTNHDRGIELARKALIHTSKYERSDAADTHDKLANLHDKMSEKMDDDGKGDESSKHEMAAMKNRKASALQRLANLTINSAPLFPHNSEPLEIPTLNFAAVSRSQRTDNKKAVGSNADYADEDYINSTAEQYGMIPPRKNADDDDPETHDWEDNQDDDLLIIPTLQDQIDGRGKATVKRQSDRGNAGSDEDRRERENRKRLGFLVGNVSYPDSELLKIPTIDWATGHIS